MDTKFQSAAIFVVKEVEGSRHFHEHLPGQEVEMDFGPNVGFAGGLAIWQIDRASEMIFERPSNITGQLGHDNFELYFESDDLDAAETRSSEFGVPFVHALREQPWSQRVFRIYDPDEHIAELGELMPAVMLRFLGEEMSSEQIAEHTFLPLDIIRQIADGEASHRCIDCSKKHM